MRRPRSKLQVSTFPFLAVLLCAMGSLLLLLFIMDRRGKIAAQHFALEIIAKKKKRTIDEEEARKAEWEQAKERLRQSLMSEEAKLAEHAEAERIKLKQSGLTLEAIKAQQQAAKAKYAQEAQKIAELRLAIESQRASITNSAKKETATKAELLQAAKDLADLETALRQLQSVKTEEKEIFSLVPYRGKQGEYRKPIYVECVDRGVIFQPDGYERFGLSFTPESIRAVIEARAGKLVPEKSEKEKSRLPPEQRTGPYVLFLVRPGGISSYYKAQSVLRGYEIDFGYELIDEDWTFDFTKKNPAPPPIRVVSRPRDLALPRPPIMAPQISAMDLLGSSPLGGGGSPFGIGASGTRPRVGVANPGGLPAPGGNQAPNGIGVANPGSNPPSALPPGVGGPASEPIPSGIGSVPGVPSPSGVVNPAGPIGSGAPGAPRVDTGIPVQRPAFVPIGKSGGPILGAPDGTPGSQPIASNVNNGPLSPIKSPIPGSSVGSGSTGATAPPSQSSGTGQGNASGGTSADSVLGKPSPFKTSAPGGGSSGETPSGKPSFGPRPSPAFGGQPKAKPEPTPPPLARTLGNKDFIITLDCYAEHVTVFPGGTQFRWKSSGDTATDTALAKHVANLIARRQASVRPDEPPYRPTIRFQVATEGVQTFLRSYPVLEPLRVPMTKENVQD